MASSSITQTGDSSSPKAYDVFISFHGEDTRFSFTDHLFNALRRKNIAAYLSKDGSTVADLLRRAIEESQIFIVVFSKSYAFSTGCLRELEQILLQCGQPSKKLFIPVFCDVDPSDVRRQRGSYQKAFDEHERRFSREEVRGWREALTQAANFPGWDLHNKIRNEVIEQIVETIMNRLPLGSALPNVVVEMDSLFEELENELSSQVPNDVVEMDFCIEELEKELSSQVPNDVVEMDFRIEELEKELSSQDWIRQFGILRPPETYDVFVSFNGYGTGHSFTDHLFHALRRKNIVAFRDRHLKRGEYIVPELFRAIEASQIFIVVFSKSYASSTWCLQELEHILLHCSQSSKKPFIPVFCDVDPSHVRNQSGCYQDVFTRHERRFAHEKVREWREALTQAAKFSGWVLRHRIQNEVMELFVEDIINRLNLGSTDPKDVVGMDSRIEELEKCLLLESVDDVRAVGIWGMGGVGKTTLARVLFGKISHQFDAYCFINDVSKLCEQPGPTGVHQEIVHQTLGREHHQIYNLHDATSLIQRRLYHCRALLVFDNVDHRKQLEKLAGNRESLLAGSRIIIVCRDAHILEEFGVDALYKVPLLNQANSLQLFCQILSKHNHVVSNPEDLAHDLLSYTNGLPLAIKALGSLLDGLDMMEKEIFCHIACFFNGHEKDYVRNVLKCCNFSVEKGLTILIEKSLITITDENKIEMHAFLEKLGKKIVHEHSGKWSRLWLHEQFNNVVSENMENNVEAVVLYGSEREKGIQPETLSKMNRLRLLILKEVKFFGSLNSLSKTLRYVEWDEYPFSDLPSSFQPDQLVELILVDSSIKQLWIDTKDLPNLRTLDLSYSENLTKMPYFGDFPNLKRLNLEGCTKLVQIDPSIGLLRGLAFLNLKNCENLVCIPNEVSGLTSLTCLNLCGCSKAFNNPNVREDFASCLLPSLPSFSCLSALDVGFCGLSQIPDALGSLTWLERLNLRGNNFVTLPGLQDLSKLEYLNLEHCKQLTSLPELPSPAAIKQDKHTGAGMLLIFNCPKLGESEQYSNMIPLWTMHFIQANQYSSASFRQIDIVIPGREIPKWFNNRRMGRSISIDPYPFVYDKNIIGIACCAIFSVEPFDLSTTRYEWGPVIRLGFKSSSAANCNYVVIPVTLFRYLIMVKSNHMWLIYFDREHFISFLSSKDNALWELDHIKMEASATSGQGLLLEVKSCGYRWVYKQDVQDFNSTMMHPGNMLALKRKFLEIEDEAHPV